MGSLSAEVRWLIVKARRKGKRMKDIEEIFGVKRWTVWKWCKRAHHVGRTRYRDWSRKPHTTHPKVSKDTENAIIVLRDSFNWGTHRIKLNLHCPPGYIRYLLSTITGRKWKAVILSRQTINAVLRKHRRNGSPFKRNKKDWHYFRARKPNNLWQIDIKGPFLMDGKRLYALVIIDDYSRYLILCSMFPSIKKDKVVRELDESGKKFGFPKRLLCDNGSQFKSAEVKDWCKENRVKYDPAPPYYPQSKGKVERTIRNFMEEFIVLDKVFDNSIDLLPEYNRWYNSKRYSSGIKGPPAWFYL
jgi:transposase InsO family protein